MSSEPRCGKVLLIDDEPQVRAALKECLEGACHTVVEAADGLEGVARAAAERFDLVLTNLTMPGLSGWEVAATLKRLANVPVGFITGWMIPLDPAQVAAAGVQFVLTKPVQLDDFLRRVAEALADFSALPSREPGPGGPEGRDQA